MSEVRLILKDHQWERLAPHEKKRLLNLALSNCEWRRGEITAAYRQPFDFLAGTVAIAATEKSCGATLSTGRTGWLGD